MFLDPAAGGELAVEGIYARSVPIPQSVGDSVSQLFLSEVKTAVVGVIEAIRKEVDGLREEEQGPQRSSLLAGH